jgi:hypothetical protein
MGRLMKFNKFFICLGCILLISTNSIFPSHSEPVNYETPEYNKSVETNFLSLDLKFFKIGGEQQQIVFGAFKNIIYVSNRESNRVSTYRMEKNASETEIKLIEEIVLPAEKDSKNYILDIEAISTTRFAVSKVEFYDDPSKCSVMNLYVHDTIMKKTKKIYTSKPCLGGVGAWSEIDGRLAIDQKNSLIYISGGNVLTDLYANTFPRPGICCLSGTFEENMKKTNLYGSIVSVNLVSKKQIKISDGHRAPQGLEFDPDRKLLFSTEHGPRGGDELNLIEEGNHYGWPYVTFGREYLTEQKKLLNNFKTKPKTNSHEGFTEPLYSWVPSVAPSQLAIVNSKNPFSIFWKGDILVSTLKDKSIRRIRLGSKDQFIYDERIEVGKRIRDLEPSEQGLIASTDDGYLILITPNNQELNGVFPPK